MNEVLDTTQQEVGQTSASPTDNTGQPADSQTANEANAGATSSPEAFDKNPKWIAARAVEKQTQDLLASHGYESLEDLTSDLAKGKDVIAAIGDRDVNTIISNSETLDKYNAHWAEQEAQRTTEDFTPEDKVAVLEKKLNDFLDGAQQEKQAATAKEQNEQALNGFKSEVNSYLAKNENIPEEYRPFIAEFSGVDNRFNDIENIADKTQVRSMMNANSKKFQDFEQAVIKRYIDGKIKIPVISETTPADTTPKRDPIKNIEQAKVVALANLKEMLARKASQP